jgi:putative membrane-bound dehydrogenase-like protein
MTISNYSVLVVGPVVFVLASIAVPRAQPEPTPGGMNFTVQPGFEVELVAGPPLVNRPIVADFDDEGRLYVADSSGSNDKVEKQLADRPHRIMRLEDGDGDGRFDRSTVFADRMMFPEGAMWLEGSLYVAAPPSIWKLTDTDGDGAADLREEWLQGKTLTGCANDLHGPYLGPDGWIYWTKGAFAEQTYERPGKAPLVTRASHIFRRKPGDRTVDVVMTGGMDNPVDVAFTPAGQRILSATFVEHPESGRRDGLLHAVYGGVYGKPHSVIDGHKRTGDLMPIMAGVGPAVPAGLTRYASRVFGDDFRDNFFAAMFNLRKVTRHVLEPSGATFTVRESDFLVSENRDFHPTDVLEDADGSLLVIDTGPWFTLCCPTSQIAKPQVLGGIYRVRRAGAAQVRDPRGRALAWKNMEASEVSALLSDPRPVVRDRAVRESAARGVAGIPALQAVLQRSPAVEARRNAVWALTRIEGAPARAAVREALGDRDEGVQLAALHSVALWRDTDNLPQLTAVLRSGSASVQRAAAEALGRAGDARAVPHLLALAAAPVDRVLEHSITYALIEINDPGSTASGLQAAASRARRTALIALDQMDDGALEPGTVVGLLDSKDLLLKETAWWIVVRRPAWSDTLAGFFAQRLGDPALSQATREELQGRLAQFGEHAAIQDLLARAVTSPVSGTERLTALRAMAVVARTRVRVLPSSWMAPLVSVLSSDDPEVVTHALSVVRAAPAPRGSSSDLQGALLRVGRDRARTVEMRLDAVAAMPEGFVPDADVFEVLRAGLEPSQSSAIRAAAARGIEKARLDAAQLTSLAASIQTAGPLELPRLMRAYAHSDDERAGLAMIAAVRQAPGRASVRADILRPVISKYPESVRQEGETLLASSRLDSAGEARRLEELLSTVNAGDASRGHIIFNGAKAACSSCHTIGYIGGKLGPDLTRIGHVRTERDLLEAIVFPSASFARGYEPVVVQTRSGEVRSGLLRGDLPDEVVLASGERDETRIPRRDVVELQPGTVSLMPQGLEEQLTRQELADLIAFLKTPSPGR